MTIENLKKQLKDANKMRQQMTARLESKMTNYAKKSQNHQIKQNQLQAMQQQTELKRSQSFEQVGEKLL